MSQCFILKFILAMLLSVEICMSQDQTRIINGTLAKPKEFPYMVAVMKLTYSRVSPSCGGSLITRKTVLTAAHCTVDREGTPYEMDNFFIIAGIITYRPRDSSAVIRAVENIFFHKYDYKTIHNDIAILRLVDPFPLNDYIKLIPVATKRYRAGTKCIAIGWGNPNPDLKVWSEAKTLLKIELSIYNDYNCRRRWHGYQILPSQYCAFNPGFSTCSGDSGGPFICNGVQVGIVSFGAEKNRVCLTSAPIVLTDVSKYLNLIKKFALSGGNSIILKITENYCTFLFVVILLCLQC